MYDYRKMTQEERQQTLRVRRERGFPLHAPPHFRGVSGRYLITAACFEHQHIFEQPEELSYLAEEMLGSLKAAGISPEAWVFLPNHYHFLSEMATVSLASETLRLAHSRIATTINGRQHQRGRKVWYRFSDRWIRNEKHYFATVNYIHYNPVKHAYVDHAADWAWSSVHEYFETHGEDWVLRQWKEFPIKDYGKGWDWKS
jgi:putative transposase